MIAGMGQAPGSGPGSRADHPQDVEVTGDLPMSLTTFVGRERELDELRSLFREGKRLVTLVGIGGIGKTRLTLELGFSAGDLGWAKVYLVELASLADPGLVDGAVLESVDGGSSRSPLQATVEYLREANALLVLDCCEHVLNAARRVAEVLFQFTDPPLRHSLPVVLAFAASAGRPAAVLTGPVAIVGTPPGVIRLACPASTCDMVRVSIAGQPLTATAALVWNGDLPRPLQQILFDTADSLIPPAPESLSRAG